MGERRLTAGVGMGGAGALSEAQALMSGQGLLQVSSARPDASLLQLKPAVGGVAGRLRLGMARTHGRHAHDQGLA